MQIVYSLKTDPTPVEYTTMSSLLRTVWPWFVFCFSALTNNKIVCHCRYFPPGYKDSGERAGCKGLSSVPHLSWRPGFLSSAHHRQWPCLSKAESLVILHFSFVLTPSVLLVSKCCSSCIPYISWGFDLLAYTSITVFYGVLISQLW